MKRLILFVALFTSQFSSAEFSPNNLRYISGYDLQTKLEILFPSIIDDDYIVQNCYQNKFALGFNNPVSGKPISQNPTSSTIQLITSCLTTIFSRINMTSYSTATNSTKATETVSHFIPATILSKYANQNLLNTFLLLPIVQLSNDEQKEIVRFMTQQFLGTDETIKSYGLMSNIDDYRNYLFTQINPNMTILSACTAFATELSLRDEFLTY
jgi:hypothetical protein